MTRHTDRDRLPRLSRREALAFLGVGGLSILGLITAFKPELLVGHRRAEGAPVSVERVISDGTIEYRPASDTVRWSKSTDQTGPYVTEPFEKWASRSSASVGSEVVVSTIQDRVGKEVTGIGEGVSGEIIGSVISVHIGSTFDVDGNVISQPNIPTERLVAVTPRTVRTTITLEGREYTRPIPVFIEEVTMYED